MTHDPLLLALFPITVLGAWLITFLTMAAVGTLAFVMESSVAIFEVWFGLYGLLSGYLLPLELFPAWAERISRALPFRYQIGFPVEMLIGMMDRGQALHELAIQWGFVVLLAGVNAVAWRFALRHHAAYGG